MQSAERLSHFFPHRYCLSALVANRDAAGRSVDVGFEIDEGERIGNCRAPPRGRLLVLGFVELGFE
jgi:hypothetical protein